MMNQRIEVICRAARESDTGDMIEVTRTIWDGQDYVPQAWPRWLADPYGRLIVAEHAGRVIGLTRLKRQEPGAWWLQGLRVQPEFQGRGVASQLHRAAVDAWRAIGDGALRLATSSKNGRVQHLCAQDGFTFTGEYTLYLAMGAPADDDGSMAGFEPIGLNEAGATAALLRRSPACAWQNGLMELGWQFAPFSEKYAAEALERGMGWRQAGRGTALLLYDDEDDGRPRLPFIQGLACPTDGLAALLGDYRRLAARLGYPGAAWLAPVKPEATAALQAAGFQREWDDGLYVFTLER